ncbi:MAG: KH domain-containing protein, partial [Nitrosopumilus sp.]
ENVIVPISQQIKKVGIEKLAEDKIRETFKKYDPQPIVEILSDNRVKVSVNEHSIASIIGKGGSNINEIEKYLNIHIDVVSKENEPTAITHDLPFTFSESKTGLVLSVAREFALMHVDIYVDNNFITSTKIGRKGQIKIPKRSDVARNLMNLASSQNNIRLLLKDF